MATSVDSLSNHYDTLRVAPTATNNEIAEAFASQMRSVRVRPDLTVARLAQLSLAYETLRDPAKRRAYDDKLGLNRPAPPPPPRPKAAPYVFGAYGPSRVKFVPTPPATAKKEPVRPDAPAEPRVAAFIAASLREAPAEPDAEAAPPPKPASRPAPAPEPEPEAEMMVFTPSPEGPAIDRNRATIAAGVVGLAALAFAISLPRSNADSLPNPTAPVQQAVTVGLPPAKPVPDYVVPPEAAPVAAAATRESQPKPAPKTAAEATTTPADKATGEPATEPAAPVEIASDQAPAAETAAAPAEPAPAAADARMPLPNATIARTIERIGYSCGSVSSVVAESAPGVFKVTCSSGASYRASPQGGRYHFRRLGSH